MVRLTRKPALLAAAARLPKQPSDVEAGMQLPGYVASLTADAVYVRFLNQTTGRAGLAHLPPALVTDPRKRFAVGQTVVARVTGTDSERALCTLSLKEPPADVSWLANLFACVWCYCSLPLQCFPSRFCCDDIVYVFVVLLLARYPFRLSLPTPALLPPGTTCWLSTLLLLQRGGGLCRG